MPMKAKDVGGRRRLMVAAGVAGLVALGISSCSAEDEAVASAAEPQVGELVLEPTAGHLLKLTDLPVAAVRETGESEPVELSGQAIELGVCPTNEGSNLQEGEKPDQAWEQAWYDPDGAGISPGAYEQVFAWKSGPQQARLVFEDLAGQLPDCAAAESDDGDSPIRMLEVAGPDGAQEVSAFFTARNHWRDDNEAVGFAQLGNTLVMVRSLIPGDQQQDAENTENLHQMMDTALQRLTGQPLEFRYVLPEG
ncbi:hypothetical protein [Kineosporia babensis]|uniref:PknH-like extracellular domain-containing protein n=1 Tax=Kineosporia babensis TaxID=499548 RepID=A0A9X1NMN7_9ACTN|nr:hypothetical protein [Kineosporia babensis]MCD5316574.1 hypothetical protein [Kineosporia babensis]